MLMREWAEENWVNSLERAEKLQASRGRGEGESQGGRDVDVGNVWDWGRV